MLTMLMYTSNIMQVVKHICINYFKPFFTEEDAAK